MSEQHPSGQHRSSMLVLEETRRELTHWAPIWARWKEKLAEATIGMNGLEESHPEWIHADQRDVATHYCVVVGLVCAMILDTFLISAVAEFAASVFFPNRPAIVAIARLLIPSLLVGFEVMVAVLTISAKDWPHWRGMLPEYRLFVRIGWLLVAVTPLMVVASLLAGGMLDQGGLILLAVAQMVLGGALHAVVVKGGRWIREAFAYFRFRFNLRLAQHRVDRAKKNADEAGREIEIIYPVFESCYLSLRRALPERMADAGRLPLSVQSAIESLFGKQRADIFRRPPGNDPDNQEDGVVAT